MNISSNRSVSQVWLVLIVLVLVHSNLSLGQEPLTESTIKLFSEVLQEERVVQVHLPDSYNLSDQASYPVLYMLDANGGRTWEQSTKTVYELQKSETIPNMIIVGIHNTVRNRDMIPAAVPHRKDSGGSKKFLTFIRDELMPKIDTTYRTNNNNFLIGFSNSGIFAVYALLEAPGLFHGIMASSPMIGHCDEFMTELAQKSLEVHDLKGLSLFMIYGTEDSPRVLNFVPQYFKMLQGNASDEFHSELIILENEGHVPASSLHDGLKFIFYKKKS